MSDVSLAAALAAKPTLRDEQVKAVRHVTQNSGNVQCVCGWAGTGKTFMLDAARLAWERDGYKVYGAALSGKAAKELSKGANLESATIAKWIYDLDRPGRKDRLTLDSKTILVVDEAGMVGTRQLHRLMTEVERAGARLVLVGDDKQLQSIGDAGGGFSGLSKRLGYAELKEITRQRDAADRQAVYDLAEGNPEPALKSYSARGRLVVGEDRADTMERLVADWCRDKTDLKEKLILSSTNRQAATLNGLCQEERQRRGELGRECVTVQGGAEVHAGDRVLFRRNDKRFGVHNGDLATVIKVTTADKSARRPAESVTVKLDSDEVVTVPLSESESRVGIRRQQPLARLLRDHAQVPRGNCGEYLCVHVRRDDRRADGLRPGVAGEGQDPNLYDRRRGWPGAFSPHPSDEPRSQKRRWRTTRPTGRLPLPLRQRFARSGA